MKVPTVSAEALRKMQINNEPVKVVMTMSRSAFRKSHIAGSSVVESVDELHTLVDDTNPNCLVVLYCTPTECQASHQAFHMAITNGISNVVVLEGGLQTWLDKGYPIEGDQASS